MSHSFPVLRSRLAVLTLSILAIFFTVALHAQSSDAKLEGTVLDAQGNAVVNAMVTVKGEAKSKTVRSDASGHYSVEGLAAGNYTVEATAATFAKLNKNNVVLVAGQTQQLILWLSVNAVTQDVTVNAGVDSIAAQTAPSGGFLEERSAQSLIANTYIENFTSPVADYGEIVQIVPGAFTVSSDGIGLGQSKTYFRGFPDGDYDIDFDGIPFYDTNSPTHHSWAFFPSQWVGGVDFDRSPGSASTIGPTPFGGSIHLLSKPLTSERDIRGTFSYGSWNTKLYDVAFNSGSFGVFGGAKKSNLFVDWHRLTSDGYQTFNFQVRNAGSLLYQYQFSPKTVLTGFSGVLRVNANTPGFGGPYRCQTLGASPTGVYTCNNSAYVNGGPNNYFVGMGRNFLMTDNSDPVNWLDYQYSHYQVPTDFEYVGLKTEFGKGWYMEVKPYTYNYDNTEPFANNTPMTENDSLATVPGSYIDPKIAAPTVLGTTLTKNLAYNGVAVAPCNLMVVKSGLAALPCGVDKYNSYRKYGETSVLTQTSKYGVFRTGLWYEWARTNRHQYPSDPLNNWTDQPLPNFDESFWTNSFQPYAEYEYHLTKQLNVTGGVKYAGYTFDILHRADNGKTVGPLTCYVAGVVPTAACAATITDTGSFTAWLPSFDMNYRIKSDWSIYAQVATGSIVPPSNVYDYNHTVSATNPTPGLLTPPKQQKSTTYQGGSVYKGNKITLDADAYYIQFDNSYSSVTDPSTSEQVFYLQPGSISKGIEFESNFVLSHGLSFYLNATAGNATYSGTANANTTATQLTAPYMVTAPTGLWVAMTPADTEASGITYNSHGLDLGFYTKRVGEMRVDNGSYHNQNIINPFDVTSCYANYTVRNHSLFDQTKFRLSINNLLNQNNLVSETLTGTKNTQLIAGTSFTDPFTTTAATAPAAGDTVGFLSGRSVTFSVTFGFAPGNRKK